MIIQKSTINSINQFYITYIKLCIEEKMFLKEEMEKQICDCLIFNKNIAFTLKYKYDSELETGYVISGLYYPVKYKRKNSIEIILRIAEDFSSACLEGLYFLLKSYLIHEIEHHLQNYKVSFREKLPIKNHCNDFEYITAPSELEAYLKSMYYTHRKTSIPFKEILMSESKNVSTYSKYQLLFRQNIYNYLKKRKDLNIMKNINL